MKNEMPTAMEYRMKIPAMPGETNRGLEEKEHVRCGEGRGDRELKETKTIAILLYMESHI
jgi:hypothetical protein